MQVIRQNNGRKSCAAVEYVLTEFNYAVGNANGLKPRATTESVGFDCFYARGDNDFFYSFVSVKALFLIVFTPAGISIVLDEPIYLMKISPSDCL